VGYTATWAGLAVAPVGLLALVAAPIVGRNMNRMNLRLAASFAFLRVRRRHFLGRHPQRHRELLAVCVTAIHARAGDRRFLSAVEPDNAVRDPPSDLASASGLSNFVRTMSGSIATAMTVFMWNRRTDYHHAVLTEHVRNSAGAWTEYQAELAGHGVTGSGAFQYVEHVITTQAMTLGVNDVFNVLGGCTCC
jgi:DHA2 family multidrug resistance protein